MGFGCWVVNVFVGRNNIGILLVKVVLAVVNKLVEFGLVDVEIVNIFLCKFCLVKVIAVWVIFCLFFLL